MTVYITAHADRYLDRYRTAARELDDEFGVPVRILVSTPIPRGTADDDVVHLHDPDWQEQLTRPVEGSSVAERLRRHASQVPGDVHRTDLRLDLGLRTGDQLALESAILADRIAERFADDPPSVVFTSSGTNVVHSIANHLASAAGARVYRIHQYLNLNVGMRGSRIWFCANNRMTLSKDPADLFGYADDVVDDHIRELHEATLARVHRLDELAKRFRSRRMPTTLGAAGLDVARVARGRLSGNPKARPAGNLSRDRLRVLRNARRLRRLAIPSELLRRPYLLFALNTPYDSQILVRAPQYRDFLSLVELVAGLVPYGMDLVLREHPAFVGSLDHDRLCSLQRRHPHVRLVSSDDPLPEVLSRAQAMMIINNTAFVDGVLLEKPVIALGDGYFKGHGLVCEIEYLQNLRRAFSDLRSGQLRPAPRGRLAEVMSRLYHETWPPPGVVDDDKVGVILTGMRAKLRRLKEVHGSEAIRA